MHRESDFVDMDYSPERCIALGREARTNQDYVWLVAEHRETITGMIGGYVSQTYFGSGRVARDFLVYVIPVYRGGRSFLMLVNGFVAWAKDRGATKVHLSSSANMGDVGPLYERIGFDRVGSIHRRNL